MSFGARISRKVVKARSSLFLALLMQIFRMNTDKSHESSSFVGLLGDNQLGIVG